MSNKNKYMNFRSEKSVKFYVREDFKNNFELIQLKL
jgi:hypothetical protein